MKLIFLSLAIFSSSLKTEEINEGTVANTVKHDDDIGVQESVKITETELPQKKKKKKRKKELESVKKAVDCIPAECPDEKPKKRKKKEKSSDSS